MGDNVKTVEQFLETAKAETGDIWMDNHNWQHLIEMVVSLRARAEAAEARVPELQAALDAAINMNIDANAKVARLTAALEEANSALISMVYQYCYRPLDANKEPAIDIYQHDFMSAGEEAFAYLVEHGLAKWTDESHYAILINSKTSLSVKSDD